MVEPSEHAAAQAAYTPKEILRNEFGRRLQAELIRKGWNQSELARQAGLHMPNKHFGRDLVSGYIRGKILPSPVHMHALCAALGKKPEDFLPPGATLPDNAPIKTQELGDGRVMLQINQIVDWSVALEVLRVLKGTTNG